MRLRRRHKSCPNGDGVSCKRCDRFAGVASKAQPYLAHPLPNPDAVRPISLLRSVGPCGVGSAHRVMLLQLVLQIIGIEYLVAFRAADVFVPGHVLHLPQVILL